MATVPTGSFEHTLEEIDAAVSDVESTKGAETSLTAAIEGIAETAATTAAQSAVSTAIGTLDASSKGGTGKYIKSISETDGVISATPETMDTAPTESSTKAVTSGGVKTYVDNAVTDKITITNILGAGTRISATQSAPIDLDDYTSVGRYNWLSNATAYISHLPVSGKGGLLEVSYIQGSSTILHRVYLSDGANSPIAFYQRFRYGSNPATWTGWYKFEGTAVT